MTNILSDSSAEADKVDKSNTIIVTNNDANEINELTEQIKSKTLSVEEQRQMYTTRGTSGLVNIDNTCYMNSAIQLMAATDQLAAYFRGTGAPNSARYKPDLRRGVSRLIVENERKKQKKMGIEPSENQVDENGNQVPIKYTININKMRKKFKNSLTYKLRNVLCVMWGSNRKIKPVAFKEKLGEASKEFVGGAQNDSQECLSLVLDRIHEETKSEIDLLIRPLEREVEIIRQTKKKFEKFKGKRGQLEYIKYKNNHLKEFAIIEALEYWKEYLSKNNSMIEHIFAGLFFGTIKCGECNNSSFKFEPFKIINLPLIQHESHNANTNAYYNANNSPDITLQECLSKYFGSGEKLEGDCQYSCDVCEHKTNAVKTTQLWYCPQRLIIQFKRFERIGNFTRKITQKVVFPIEGLDMSEYVSVHNRGEHIYDLYAISFHSGSPQGGHYTAYSKNPINGMWYYYDDSNVVHIEDNKLESRLVTPGAYILMYKARKPFSSIIPDEMSDEYPSSDDNNE